MAYSSATQVRNKCGEITTDVISDVNLALRIVDADKEVEDDLQNFIDFDLVPAHDATVPTPNFINLLSIYKTIQFVLAGEFAKKRGMQTDGDLKYYMDEYKRILKNAKRGVYKFELSDGTSIQNGDAGRYSDSGGTNVKPPFGEGPFGEFLSESQLEERRPLTGDASDEDDV